MKLYKIRKFGDKNGNKNSEKHIQTLIKTIKIDITAKARQLIRRFNFVDVQFLQNA